MQLPLGFIEMMTGLLGKESAEFLHAMQLPPVTSVRLNSRKPSGSFEECRGVKWCEKGVYLDDRPVFTLDPLLHAGAYYVQDASSMIYYETVKRILRELRGDGTRLSILDMCAAPGGKCTAMIDAVPDGTRVVANEYVGRRAGILRENLAKWGYPGVTVTNCASSVYAGNGDAFDIVAVDAPCSGEGMMRKDSDAVEQWSMDLVGKCAELQREILADAVAALRPGGFLIYSTCTFNRFENEENAGYIKDKLGMLPYDPGFPEEWGIPRGIDTDLPVYRFMPHKTEGEGLFLAVFRHPGEYVPRMSGSGAVSAVRDGSLSVVKGRKTGKKGSVPEVPAIEEILSVEFDRDAYPVAELDLDKALAYLRRESVTLSPGVPKGIVMMAYKGLLLGPAKNIGSRANNLYPKNWRILMR